MKETTRQRLIDAAYEEIYSNGYQGAALADILNRAGVHKGSMYHFFDSKKAMALCAIREKMQERFARRYGELLNGGGPYLPRLFGLLRDTQQRDFRRGCPLANLVQEMSNLDGDFDRTLKEIYGEFGRLLAAVYDHAVASGELSPCDTKRLGLFSVMVLEGALLSVKASGNVQDYTDAVDVLEEYVQTLRR